MDCKCKYCGKHYDDNDDYNYRITNGIDTCPNCSPIKELDQLLYDYRENQNKKEFSNEVFIKNLIEKKDFKDKSVKSFSLDEHETSYEVIGESIVIDDLIKRIEYIRELLALEVDAQFKILDSIYVDKNEFWNETGNLLRYVHNASYEYVVIKIKDLISNGKSEYSIKKIKNIIVNNKKNILKSKQVFHVYNFKNGDTFKIKFESFPIDGYIDKIDYVLKYYENIIKSISDYRDNQFAHINNLKDINSTHYLTYINIKRVYKLIQLIYNGFLYAIAPERTITISVDHNISFTHLDYIVECYRKHKNQNS